ncbi:hypothetical protein [Pseudomonas sp. EA_35y_Pfl2_R5]|uniref:hypothetical protein n=1 Tax=Pseudomonas sp. EA_35y_Pfl2_R5 TaxID=3088690 RepID=UPI0030D99FFA
MKNHTSSDHQGNALAVWARKVDSYESIVEKRETALRLAVECVNDGTLDSLDGVGSPLSKKIMEVHGVELFEMNSNWVETSQYWRCPCCDRSKLEISRVGNKGQILAKLVEHHDHMSDALKAAFNKVFVESCTRVSTKTGLAMVERMSPAFSAYAPVLICEDCNNSDAVAKRVLSEQGCNVEWQSFSIGQIRQFISVSKHASHEMDEAKVKSLWQVIRPAYVARMNLIYQVAKAAVLQDYWYEKYPVGMVAVPTLTNGYGRHGGLELVNAEAFGHEMTRNTIAHQANLTRWRTENKPAGGAPPDNYTAILLSLPGCARMWNELDSTWKCPICDRSKFEIVTFRKGKVSFLTDAPDRRSPAWGRIRHICMGCCSVVRSMKLELEKGNGLSLGGTFRCITPDQLRSIITPRPHSSPLIDKQKAKAFVDAWVCAEAT